MAKPHEGSRNRVEKTEKEPAIGNATTSSPRLCMVQYWKAPVKMYARIIAAGPLWYSAIPEATNNPVPTLVSIGLGQSHSKETKWGSVPTEPPMAIIWR